MTSGHSYGNEFFNEFLILIAMNVTHLFQVIILKKKTIWEIESWIQLVILLSPL